jgi:amino acid transporter
MIIMSIVVFYFMFAATRYIILKDGFTGLFSTYPFYNPESFSLNSIGSATALAALTYIGFDGLTTLSEEVKNPKRNVLIAVVLTCLITGIWSGAQVYLAQLSWPEWTTFTQGITNSAAKENALDTAIMTVANRVGGFVLDFSLSVILLIGSIGSGITGQMGAARLLYGMGRDSVIPRNIFGHLSKKNQVPNFNVIIIGSLTLIGALTLNYQETARLINFGAFLAFMGVNIASINEYFIKSKIRTLKSYLLNLLPPLIGFTVSLIIWISLPYKTFLIGGSWLIVGIVYLLFRTKGFRKPMVMIDFS